MPRTPDIKDAIINQIVIGLGSTVIKLASKKLININTTLKYAFFILAVITLPLFHNQSQPSRKQGGHEEPCHLQLYAFHEYHTGWGFRKY